MKKAMELSILCDCHVAVLVFCGDKYFQYSSDDMDSILQRYSAYDGSYEALTNNELGDLKPGKTSSFRTSVVRQKAAEQPTASDYHRAQQHHQQQHSQQFPFPDPAAYQQRATHFVAQQPPLQQQQQPQPFASALAASALAASTSSSIEPGPLPRSNSNSSSLLYPSYGSLLATSPEVMSGTGGLTSLGLMSGLPFARDMVGARFSGGGGGMEYHAAQSPAKSDAFFVEMGRIEEERRAKRAKTNTPTKTPFAVEHTGQAINLEHVTAPRVPSADVLPSPPGSGNSTLSENDKDKDKDKKPSRTQSSRLARRSGVSLQVNLPADTPLAAATSLASLSQSPSSQRSDASPLLATTTAHSTATATNSNSISSTSTAAAAMATAASASGASGASASGASASAVVADVAGVASNALLAQAQLTPAPLTPLTPAAGHGPQLFSLLSPPPSGAGGSAIGLAGGGNNGNPFLSGLPSSVFPQWWASATSPRQVCVQTIHLLVSNAFTNPPDLGIPHDHFSLQLTFEGKTPLPSPFFPRESSLPTSPDGK